jgi:ssDNA-binding Zn-finger/Zn-ribbon topoisomerase 1
VSDDEHVTRAGRLPKELVGVDCPKCGYLISQDTDIVYNREDQFFVGFNLVCPKCGNKFSYTLY